MEKVKIVKSLLVLVLLPGFFAGCQGLPNRDRDNQGVTPTQSSEETIKDNQSTELTDSTSSNPDVKKIYDKVASLEEQNNVLKTQVNTLTSQVNKLEQKLITLTILLGIVSAVVIVLWVKKRCIIYQRKHGMVLPPSRSVQKPLFQSLLHWLTGRKEVHNTTDNLGNDASYTPESQFNESTAELSRIDGKDSSIETRLPNREYQSSYQTPHSSLSPNQQLIQPVPETRINYGNDVSSPPAQIYPIVSYAPWVDTYNKNPDLLLKNATVVSETEESIEQRRLGYKQAPILEQDRRGNYWILTLGGYNYLVPKGNMRINEYSYKTVESLFQCDGYTPGSSSKFRLIKPAKVFSSGKQWELVEAGVIEFI